jgi:hypothetical protein
LYQIFLKNYYVQIGRKGCWKNTTHFCVIENRLFTIENNSKIYETNVETGKWKEVFNLDSNPLNKESPSKLVKKVNNESIPQIGNGPSPSGNHSNIPNSANHNSNNSHNSSFAENFDLDGSDNDYVEPTKKHQSDFFERKKYLYDKQSV